MRRLFLGTLAFALLFAASAAEAKSYTETFSKTFPFDRDGVFMLDNRQGRIVIAGTDDAQVTVQAVKIYSAPDQATMREAASHVAIHYEGDEHNLSIRTLGSSADPDGRWSSSVSYTIRVPRNAAVRVVTFRSDRLLVQNLNGELYVRNVNGRIDLDNVRGPATVEGGNANIYATFAHPPQSRVSLSTVNGRIEVRLPEASRFDWGAETLRGEIFTTFKTNGRFDPSSGSKIYRTRVNGSGGPLLTTSAMMGSVWLLRNGAPIEQASEITPPQPPQQSIAMMAPAPVRQDLLPVFQQVERTLLIQPPTARSYIAQRDSFDGDLDLTTTVGNVFIGEVHGDARINTRAGEIVLGRVTGRCDVLSLGGPINLGNIKGLLHASTFAGDVLIRSAEKGGTASTRGGNINIGFAGGSMVLSSGGGDITVQRASSRIKAETRSGDILIAVDPADPMQEIDATVTGGNIVLTVPRNFSADVEAEIISSAEGVNRIQSDIPGLAILREQLEGGKTRIRATGKLNGGGQKLELHTVEGNIQIRVH
ncbi:MAG: DUF4097 family beta strand repeat-containing protein [Thermoanaerobaculia bacterium]